MEISVSRTREILCRLDIVFPPILNLVSVTFRSGFMDPNGTNRQTDGQRPASLHSAPSEGGPHFLRHKHTSKNDCSDVSVWIAGEGVA